MPMATVGNEVLSAAGEAKAKRTAQRSHDRALLRAQVLAVAAVRELEEGLAALSGAPLLRSWRRKYSILPYYPRPLIAATPSAPAVRSASRSSSQAQWCARNTSALHGPP